MDKISEERMKGGFDSTLNEKNYVVKAYEDYKTSEKLVYDCDLTIISYAANSLAVRRIKDKKLTFVFTESFLKGEGFVGEIKNILRCIKYISFFQKYKYKSDNVKFLMIGENACIDHFKCGISKKNIYRFAYFPLVEFRDYIPRENKENVEFLWVGRFLRWKHPEVAVNLIKELTERGYHVKLTMVGIGKERYRIEKLAKGQPIQFIDSMPPAQIRKLMQNKDVYLFTSGRGEGWGCVLSEAMAEGMTVLANYKAGATSSLVTNNMNGIVYKTYKDLSVKACELLDNLDLANEYGKNAMETMQNVWNAKVAANNLLELYNDIIYNRTSQLVGPCEKWK